MSVNPSSLIRKRHGVASTGVRTNPADMFPRPLFETLELHLNLVEAPWHSPKFQEQVARRNKAGANSCNNFRHSQHDDR